MAKLKDRQALAVRRVNADTVNAFCTALKERFTDRTSGLGKATCGCSSTKSNSMETS